MLLSIEFKTIMAGQNCGKTKEQTTKDTSRHRAAAKLNGQQTNMRKITKTQRKKRDIRAKENRLVRTIVNYISPYTLESSNKLTASTSATSSTSSTSMALQQPTRAKQNSMRRLLQRCLLTPSLVLLLLLVQSQNVTINALEQTSGHSKTTTTPTPTTSTTATAAAVNTIKYSQPFGAENNDDENSFRPIIPKDINLDYISQNVFTKAGQYRVFEPVESDLRATAVASRQSAEKVQVESTKKQIMDQGKFQKAPLASTSTSTAAPLRPHVAAQSKQISYAPPTTARPSSTAQQTSPLTSDIKGLESLLAEYVDNFFNKAEYQPKPELIMALQQNYTDMRHQYERHVRPHLPEVPKSSRPARQALITKRSNNELSVNIPRAFESGRLLFFAGLKKVMWPIYMGLQILKSLMFALLLPTLIGSFGKLLGKGLTSGSAPLFIRPMDEPQDLDFKDNNFNFDDDSNKFTLMDDGASGAASGVKDNGYAYNQAAASQTHNQYAFNQQALSRYGMNERQQLMQDSYLSALQSLGAASFKNSVGISGSSSGGGGGGGLAAPMRQKPAAPANMNTFQQFQKVPASSLLLSNYDPFYSPLLSRLDSVFAQLKLNSDDEACREKLICLMYANPAKYAPYSNLVSAQLSRELNELRKPTSDNPDILRFFKYMRAAKDGQDGIDCEQSFEKCKEFKDFENPAMVSTYHDINKLVQARKLT